MRLMLPRPVQVVQHEINCFFDLPVFAQLVEDKWQKFGYRMHVRRVLIYAFFVIVTTFALGKEKKSPTLNPKP